MQTEDKKEEILSYIAKNPGLTFRQIRFRLDLNESTLNRALIYLAKSSLLEKIKS
ncbi:hypothetical protein LCGC14_2875600 [marine sediment metagenome]|uniref:HTH marR-type domain-containing protein n=1 Tax=marine sediment metagenome TaxID=412755 RepID=A0A0F9AST4_9ZZZZ